MSQPRSDYQQWQGKGKDKQNVRSDTAVAAVEGVQWQFGGHDDDGSWKYYKSSWYHKDPGYHTHPDDWHGQPRRQVAKERLRFDHLNTGRCAARPEDCMCFYHQAIRQGACPKKLDEMREKLTKSIEMHNMKDYEEIVDSVVDYAQTYTPELGRSLGRFQDKAEKAQFDSSWISWWQPIPSTDPQDHVAAYFGVNPSTDPQDLWQYAAASSSSQGMTQLNPSPNPNPYNASADWHSPATSERSS